MDPIILLGALAVEDMAEIEATLKHVLLIVHLEDGIEIGLFGDGTTADCLYQLAGLDEVGHILCFDVNVAQPSQEVPVFCS